MDKKTLVVNFFSGPGTGKSTMAAHVFALLKWRGVNCELVTEYAKDKTWEKSLGVLEHQQYIFGKQLYRLSRLEGQVDIILTDAPILFSLVYGGEKMYEEFRGYVLAEFGRRWNFNVFLQRRKSYNQAGRSQNESEAKVLDEQILDMLDRYWIDYDIYDGVESNASRIADSIVRYYLDDYDSEELPF